MPIQDDPQHRRRRRDHPPGPLGIDMEGVEAIAPSRPTPCGSIGLLPFSPGWVGQHDRLMPRIFIYGHHAPLDAGPGTEAPETTPAATARTVKKTDWIEVLLVDEDDKPIGKEKYEITLPNAVVEKGELDDDGEVRFDDIEPGTCYVVFPELEPTMPEKK